MSRFPCPHKNEIITESGRISLISNHFNTLQYVKIVFYLYHNYVGITGCGELKVRKWRVLQKHDIRNKLHEN
jgi:hypothetical protein